MTSWIVSMTGRHSLHVVLAGVIAFGGTFALRGQVSRLVAGRTEASAGLEACRALIADFREYPLVYAGEQFEGLPLTTCVRRQTAATDYGVPATDQVIFIYGTCALDLGTPDPSCAPPLQIHVYPDWMPAPVVAVPSGETRRGVQTAFLNNGSAVSAVTPGYRVKISAAVADPAVNQALALRAFDALLGANPLATSIREGSPLTTPEALQPQTP